MELAKRIVKSKVYIDRHYAAPLDLNNLCAEACISKFHFIRAFKKTYNRTPHQYLTQKRIDKAKELLRKGKHTVQEVCLRVGFESQQSFSNKFRQVTGYTPTTYRSIALKHIQASKNTPITVIPFCFFSKMKPEE